MRPLFFALLGVYLAYAVVTNRRPEVPAPKRAHPLTLFLQSALFLAAAYLGWRQGVFSRDLVSPVYIAAGLFIGHLVFSLGLAFTHGVPRDALEHFLDVPDLGRFLAECPTLLLRFAAVSFSEEVVYRAAAQTQLIAWTGRPMVSMLVVAVCFSAVHRHFLENTWVQAAEFLAFSVLLGALYYGTGSLSLVVVIHTVRNLESLYLEYLEKAEQCGGTNAALQELERQYAPRGIRQ